LLKKNIDVEFNLRRVLEPGKRLGSFIQNRKPGPQGQVRGDRLCHRSNLFKVSGVRFQVSVNTES